MRISQTFVNSLKNATLDNDGLDPATLHQLRHPPQGPINIQDNPDLRLSLDLFLQHSETDYMKTREAILRRHPEDDIPSHYQMTRKIVELTGVDSVANDMCPNSCIGYTGPFSNLEHCPECGDPRYDPIVLEKTNGETKKARRQFHTIPVGPQLQALYRSPESANLMRHRHRCTQEILGRLDPQGRLNIQFYDDVYIGMDYLQAVKDGSINQNDITLMLSIDGAQLYRNKQSDCVVFIWVVFDLPPDCRYKKKYVLIGGIIPGLNKLKHNDSFIYQSLHHLIALQKEGLRIWDSCTDTIFSSRLFFWFGTADSIGIVQFNGLTGHRGAYGCRLYCPIKGRRKPDGKHYFPALLKPENYNVQGCNHPDIDVRNLPPTMAADYERNLQIVLSSTTAAAYRTNRRDTGISRPSIISAIPHNRSLGVPSCFVADFMHLTSLNITDLILGLFRGTLDCDPLDNKQTWDWAVLRGDTWTHHGKAVANATPYLPGSFDRPPRNPAEKISSGYKAWEFLTYVYGLGPGLFYNLLPEKYWIHFCKLVSTIRLFYQRSITPTQLVAAHRLILDYCHEFELLYYQRKPERIHFCRPSIHALPHLAPKVVRVGPQVYYTQWTIERTIGNLGEEIKQPSNPYANISQRAIHRCQVNALKAMIPDLEPDAKLPRGAKDIGDGYILLRARDEYAQKLRDPEAAAVKAYLEQVTGNIAPNWVPRVKRWARLQLPNGQIARSAWKEMKKPLKEVQMSRNVKVSSNRVFPQVPVSSRVVIAAESSKVRGGHVLFPGEGRRGRIHARIGLALFPTR